MNFTKFTHLWPIAFILALSPQLKAQQCESVFQNENANAKSRTLDDFYGISYQKSTAVSGIQTGHGTLRTFSHFHKKYAGPLIRVDVVDFLPSTSNNGRSSKDATFRSFVNENIKFVISQYQQRRDWSPEYLEAIQSDAIKFAERSTYFVAYEVKKPVLTEKGTIIGSMKVIAGDQNNPLPFEIDHNLKVPLNGGLKFEPGNFVVLKEESAIGFGEVMSHFVRFAKDVQKQPGHNPNQMIFFTDADKPSYLMYKQLGFVSVPGFEKPLVKNGKEYYLIGASTNTVLKFPTIFNAKRSEWGLGSTLDNATQTSGRSPLDHARLYFSKIEIEKPGRKEYSATIWKKLVTGGLSLYINKETGGRRLVISRPGGFGQLQFQFKLKDSELPLKAGTIRSEIDNSNGFITKTVIEYTESELIVRHTSMLGQIEMRIETNSDFSDIRAIKYTEERTGLDRIQIRSLQAPDISFSPPLS